MSILNNDIQRVVTEEYLDEDSDILGNVSGCVVECGSGDGGGGLTENNMEAEKRIRREIANSNERRRMQSINAGFQSLRTLLPHHEGEKLSKAAILQQTAEYIYNLEQEKTRLLSQNCQLMRQVQQHEGGDVPVKKRKAELLVIKETSDEGIGSSPEPQPVGLVAVVPATTSAPAELAEMRRLLDRERSLRVHLEEQVRGLEAQLYSGIVHYHQDIEVKNESDEVVHEVIHEEIAVTDLQLVAAESLPPVAHTQTVISLSRSPSPTPEPPRLPSALEAAIKAEPKVEVERLPSPPPHDDIAVSNRIYVNTSRQNLETIVEAIRHLEGDHLFGDEPQQDVPLALTNKSTTTTSELNPYLHFHTASSVQQQQQSRPGVIVVKQHS